MAGTRSRRSSGEGENLLDTCHQYINHEYDNEIPKGTSATASEHQKHKKPDRPSKDAHRRQRASTKPTPTPETEMLDKCASDAEIDSKVPAKMPDLSIDKGSRGWLSRIFSCWSLVVALVAFVFAVCLSAPHLVSRSDQKASYFSEAPLSAAASLAPVLRRNLTVLDDLPLASPWLNDVNIASVYLQLDTFSTSISRAQSAQDIFEQEFLIISPPFIKLLSSDRQHAVCSGASAADPALQELERGLSRFNRTLSNAVAQQTLLLEELRLLRASLAKSNSDIRWELINGSPAIGLVRTVLAGDPTSELQALLLDTNRAVEVTDQAITSLRNFPALQEHLTLWQRRLEALRGQQAIAARWIGWGRNDCRLQEIREFADDFVDGFSDLITDPSKLQAFRRLWVSKYSE